MEGEYAVVLGIIHTNRLAVQAGFYSDAVECWINSTQEILVRSSAGAKGD